MSISAVSSTNMQNTNQAMSFKKKVGEAQTVSPQIQNLQKMRESYEDQLKKISESKLDPKEKQQKQKEIQEQIDQIDEQIRQIQAEEQKKKIEEQTAKQEEERMKKDTITEEEKAKYESKHFFQAVSSFAEVKNLNRLRVKIKGEMRCAEGEIAASQSRGHVPTDSSIKAAGTASSRLDNIASKMAGKIEETLDEVEKAKKISSKKTKKDENKDDVENKQENDENQKVDEVDKDKKKEIKSIDIKI